jgi:hypothetical protein
MRVNRRRILQSLGLLTATGVAGCAGQSDSTPPRDDDASDSGDRAREIERKATNRAAMYGHFRETFSREYTYDELVSQALTPLGTLLETLEITDRMRGDPPAVAAAVAIAPLPDPIDALSEAKDVIVGRRYSAANAIYQCGAYTDALDTACMDSPEARVGEVRDRNRTLRTKAQAVADAAGAYRSSRTDENRARLVAALRAEFEHTAPLPALAAWTEIDASAYANRTQWERQGAKYVRNLATANASSIVAARAALDEQLKWTDGPADDQPTNTPTEPRTEPAKDTPNPQYESPKATVKAYYAAIEAGDRAAASEYTVDGIDVPRSRMERVQEQLQEFDDTGFLIDSKTDRRAEVSVVLTKPYGGEAGQEMGTVNRYTLRRQDGQWLISEF